MVLIYKKNVFLLSLFWVCQYDLFLYSTMYWADWGNHPKIETAAMDGTLRQTLVHENIQWPTGQYRLSAKGFISTQIID